MCQWHFTMFIILQAASLIEYLVASDFKLVGYCRMTPASTPLNYFNSLVVAQTKSAFYNEAFNQK